MVQPHATLTQQRLRELLSYDEATYLGEFHDKHDAARAHAAAVAKYHGEFGRLP